MIKRFAYVRLRDHWSNRDGRKEVRDTARAKLSAIPGVRRVEVGVPADAESEGAWDIAITLTFDGPTTSPGVVPTLEGPSTCVASALIEP